MTVWEEIDRGVTERPGARVAIRPHHHRIDLLTSRPAWLLRRAGFYDAQRIGSCPNDGTGRRVRGAQEFAGLPAARCGLLSTGTNTSHLCCGAGFTVLVQLTATFAPDRPWLFGTHVTRKGSAHFATRIFRFGSNTCHRVPFLAFSAAMNLTAAALISNKPCMSPRVLSSSSVAASAEAIPATRKREPARAAHMRLFSRDGRCIFIILAKAV